MAWDCLISGHVEPCVFAFYHPDFFDLCILAFLAMPFVIIILLLRITRESQRRRIAEEEATRTAQRQKVERAETDLALTCPDCGNLAPPIPFTGNRYRCPECRHQFAGDPHNV